MFSTRKISVFKFFLITYIISISIPLIMSVTLHQKLLRVIDNYNEEKYQGILSQSQQTIDQYLEGINNIPEQIATNAQSVQFITADISVRIARTTILFL